MCGIFAAVTRQKLSSGRCRRALESLHHRGPDGCGLWTSEDGLSTLGHTRLSIIGLDNGKQPMSSADGALHMVVNGEFYGYQEIREQLRAGGCTFATDSDSEIALHLYRRKGMQALTELRGEFAVIIADQREDRMIAIRDRFGIKPLYYSVVDGEIYFASEIKALLALGVPARWDLEAVSAGIGQSHERTQFACVKAVPQGCFAIAEHGSVSIYPYWDWELPTARELDKDERSESEVVADFRQVLSESVQQRLVADVEVACYLSGGIDSCAVLGLAQQELERPIRAFTLTFDDALYNEASIAEAQAKHVGSSFEPIPITGRELADGFADAVWHCETQMFNGHGVAKFLLSKAVRDAGIKVVFTGEGADEMLGGYPYFRVDAVNHNPRLSAEQKAAFIDEIFEANAASRAIMLPERVEGPEMEGLLNRLGWIPATVAPFLAMTDVMKPLFRTEMADATRDSRPMLAALDRLPLGMRTVGRDHLNQALYINSKTVLPNMILNYLGDRMEMAHSIEGRVPFLDHHVAETAAQIPIDLKIKGIREKHVLREAAKEVLIPEVYDRQKHPFTSPPTRSKSDPMMTFYRDTFASKAANEQPIYDICKARVALDGLMESAADERMATEGVLQRIASTVIMQERFGLA